MCLSFLLQRIFFHSNPKLSGRSEEHVIFQSIETLFIFPVDVLVELVNFRPFKGIEQDAEFLHRTKHMSELLLASSTDYQIAAVK